MKRVHYTQATSVKAAGAGPVRGWVALSPNGDLRQGASRTPAVGQTQDGNGQVVKFGRRCLAALIS